jgi:hypothetical protein
LEKNFAEDIELAARQAERRQRSLKPSSRSDQRE